MSANEIFCLRSNEFEEVIKSCWKQLQSENNLCDITLACEDRQFKTHKFVVSAFSPVLRNILKLQQNPHPLIYLRRVKYADLQKLITFMYQGEVDVAVEDLHSFLEAAEDLNIRGLSEANTESIISNREIPSEPTHQDIAPSPKRKRTAERQQKARFSGDNPSDDSEIKNFVNNDDKTSYNISREVKIKKYDELSSQNIVSRIADKLFQCQKCDKSFSFQRSLIRHHQSSHEGIRYACTECNYKATQKQHLQAHVAAVHEGVEYPCAECNYKATTKGILQRHVAEVHEGVKYPCTECNYKATQNTSLQLHVAAIHEGVKYPCTECNYKASFKQELKRHVAAVHEGVRYPCTECNYKATRQNNLKQHIAAKHA